MAVKTAPNTVINLAVFRRRVILLRVWHFTAVGGIAGAAIGIAALAADRLGLIDVTPMLLSCVIALCTTVGAACAIIAVPSDSVIARSVDRRSQMEDRLTTVFELKAKTASADSAFVDATEATLIPRLAALDVSRLYPLRFHTVHVIFGALTVACVVLYFLVDTLVFLPPSIRRNADQMKRAAQQVEAVAKPLLQQADKPGAAAEDKQLAIDIRHFIHDLNKGRISKQDALIRGNQLADQARQLEQQRKLAMTSALSAAESAGQKLNDMMQNMSEMQQSADSKLTAQAGALKQQISALQNMLNAAKTAGSRMSRGAQAKLAEELASLEKQLKQIEISQRAARMLAELQRLPDYQQAMAILAKKQQIAEAESLLQKLEENKFNQLGQNGQGSPTPMTPSQMKAIADQLDRLAAQMNTDSKLKAYAKTLFEAAKEATAGNDADGVGAGIDAALGMKDDEYAGAPPDYGGNGNGSTSPGTWVGDYGKLNRSDKSTLLHLKFQDHYVTSQQGANGPETYTEEIGPAKLSAKSGIPYATILPTYEKTAESALNKGDIPPEMRTKVRDYFDSLHTNQ